MPDKIEKILKEIHVLLSGCPSANESGSEVIVNKKEVFMLLERLNYALLEIMDAYEVNELSKERAIQRVQKDAQKIIDDASKSAEEIYAASIIYSDDALNELRDTVNKSRKNVMKEYEAMLKKIDSQVELIGKNRDELHMQLADLSSGNEYLNIIIDEKKRREKERERYNKVVDGEIQDDTKSRLSMKAEESRDGGTIKVEIDDYERRMSNSEVVVNVNTDHPAFKKALEEEKMQNAESSTRMDESRKAEDRSERERLLDEQLDLPPKKDGEYSAADFNLDDEYFKWKEDREKPPLNEDVDIKGTFLGRFFKSS
ncbi:MAG: hypothetical protein IK152_09910 [Lachnospiraceae bacterium]|nr:hypothetical protein [Lachnospiraceae bacterium]